MRETNRREGKKEGNSRIRSLPRSAFFNNKLRAATLSAPCASPHILLTGDAFSRFSRGQCTRASSSEGRDSADPYSHRGRLLCRRLMCKLQRGGSCAGGSCGPSHSSEARRLVCKLQRGGSCAGGSCANPSEPRGGSVLAPLAALSSSTNHKAYSFLLSRVVPAVP